MVLPGQPWGIPHAVPMGPMGPMGPMQHPMAHAMPGGERPAMAPRRIPVG